jgi:hypothetical protein
MSKLVSAIKRTLGSSSAEPSVHFHQGTHHASPEVCFEGACERPQLHVRR